MEDGSEEAAPIQNASPTTKEAQTHEIERLQGSKLYGTTFTDSQRMPRQPMTSHLLALKDVLSACF